MSDRPPEAGEATTLGRIAHVLEEVLPGDVFWPLDTLGGRNNCLAEEAFSQGAQGVVVAGRRVAPQAGCWTLELPDAWSAWQRWQAWCARRQRREVECLSGMAVESGGDRLTDACRANLEDAAKILAWNERAAPSKLAG
jgi:hypothetical protein